MPGRDGEERARVQLLLSAVDEGENRHLHCQASRVQGGAGSFIIGERVCWRKSLQASREAVLGLGATLSSAFQISL